MDKIELTPEQLHYLAQLIDLDTSGDQSDLLYKLLMQAWNACDDGARVLLSVENEEDE